MTVASAAIWLIAHRRTREAQAEIAVRRNAERELARANAQLWRLRLTGR